MSIQSICKKSFLTCYSHESKVKLGIIVFLKVIFSFGLCLKFNKTQIEWCYLFKKKIIKPKNKTQACWIAEKFHTNVQEPIGEKNTILFRLIAESILVLHRKYSQDKCEISLKKARKLTLAMVDLKEKLPFLPKIKDSDELVEKIFKKTFKAVLEAYSQAKTDDFEFSNSTKKFFGTEIYKYQLQYGKNAGKSTYIAKLHLLDEGACNKAFFAIDFLHGKFRVIRLLANNESLFVKMRLLKLENVTQSIIQEDSLLKKNMIKIYSRFNKGSVISYAEEGTLKSLIENGLANQKKKEFITQIVNFLAALHAKGYIFGDIKAENILISQGMVKFADFAGCYKQGDSNRLFSITPDYMAPEVLNTFQTSMHTDCWAVGILLYELKYTIPHSEITALPNFVDQAAVMYLENPSNALAIKDILINGLKKEPFLNLKDPYDQLIAKLLCEKPEDRLTISNLQKMFNSVPIASYSL